MNDVLQNIMTFINENTILLICICVFLILVLIGYLIDNSVKSKRVRNDIKNADQVPENIKEEIIKEAKKEDKMDDNITPLENQPVIASTNENADSLQTLGSNLTEGLSMDIQTPASNNDQVSTDLNAGLDLGSSLESAPLSLDNGTLETQTDTTDLNASLDLDNTNTSLNLSLDSSMPVEQNVETPVENSALSLDTPIETSPLENISVDPDAEIMQNAEVENNGYSNDKKLSEILSQMSNIVSVEPEKPAEENNIFEVETPSIEVNNEVKKDDVQIDTSTSATDELDNIMRKLSSATNEIQDDNYTNIF